MDFIEEMHHVGIDYVLTHHENTGAFMASAVGRLTGTPGVALVTKGPGVTNIATGIGSAYLDRSPLLLLSSTALDVRQRVGTEFLAPISKFSEEMTAATAADLLPRAVATATGYGPGPAYLACDTPEQVKELPQQDDELERIIDADPRVAEPSPSGGELDALASEVAEARRLVVVVGQLVEHAGALDALRAALDALGAPVVVTPQALGTVSTSHPLYAGMTGWHDAALRRLLPEADLVLTIGLDGADVMVPYRDLAKVIHIAPVPATIGSYQPVARVIEGDVRASLEHLARSSRGEREWGEELARETRDALDADMAVSAAHDDADGIAPQQVMSALRAVLPQDAIFTCDVGAHKITAGAVWKTTEPGTYFMSNGFGSMGYGLGTAMGAKLARPDVPVVSVIGDGGFLMYAGDLATMARLGLGVVVVVMVDNDLTQVRRRQEKAGYATASTSFPRVDYRAVAGAFGVDSARASTAAEFDTVIARAVAAHRPVLVEAELDAAEYRRIPGWK
jgi:acetolactate synthase I/II/III large subunit